MSIATDIKEHRFHDFTVDCAQAAGDAVRTATVRQISHNFMFGSNIFGLVRGVEEEERPAYESLISRLWNFGTLPFYWGRYEPVEGETMESVTLEAARWAREHGLITKGHPLCWHTVCADWLMQYDNDTILAKQLERIRRDVGRFAGLIDMWDVINEVVIMPVFDKYDNAVTLICNHIGPIELTLRCFQTARETNPDAVLLINDFDLSPDYEQLIERLLDRGCPIDVIGLQTHQHHGYHGVDRTLEVIERFSRFGKPLHFTETTILSGHQVPQSVVDLNDYVVDEWPSTPDGEAQQAERVEEYYKAIFSRPLVQAIVWWDLRDGNWLHAPAGLVRRDFSPKPAYERLERLIKDEWWLDEREVPIDADKAARFNGVAGTYEIDCGGRTTRVSLTGERPDASLDSDRGKEVTA